MIIWSDFVITVLQIFNGLLIFWCVPTGRLTCPLFQVQTFRGINVTSTQLKRTTGINENQSSLSAQLGDGIMSRYRRMSEPPWRDGMVDESHSLFQ